MGAIDDFDAEPEHVRQELLNGAEFVTGAAEEDLHFGISAPDVDGDRRADDAHSWLGPDEGVDSLAIASRGALEVAVIEWTTHLRE